MGVIRTSTTPAEVRHDHMITAEIRPAKLIEGQQYLDSENELDNPFLMDDDEDGEQLEI